MHVVFVCTGNICRSPTAEGILRSRLAAAGRRDIGVSSMGVCGLDGEPATLAAIDVCREHGVDITGHTARPLLPDELARADLVLTMDIVQREFVLEQLPAASERVHLLGSWPGQDRIEDTVHDPIGQGMRVYRQVYEAIDHHARRIVAHLLSA